MVANIYEMSGREAIARMRKRFAEDISSESAPLGIRTTFINGVTCKEAGPKKLEFTALATTDAVDCQSEVVVRDGCDWESYFAKNGMTLFADHCYGVSWRIGYARALPVKVNTPRGGKAPAGGVITEFGGRLLNADGKPMGDHVIELWQANSAGPP